MTDNHYNNGKTGHYKYNKKKKKKKMQGKMKKIVMERSHFY